MPPVTYGPQEASLLTCTIWHLIHQTQGNVLGYQFIIFGQRRDPLVTLDLQVLHNDTSVVAWQPAPDVWTRIDEIWS